MGGVGEVSGAIVGGAIVGGATVGGTIVGRGAHGGRDRGLVSETIQVLLLARV